jgi:UDP-N-acetylglucosamine 4,6-dehydratase/5-epimerase
MFENSVVLVTGGTGSFGKTFIRRLLDEGKAKKIIVYSRDEMKQYEMSKEFNGEKIRYFIGDVRDKERLTRAFAGVDYVVHAAALKIVPAAEYNPFEYIKTNINGAMNVIEAAINQKVKRVVALSTDKAANPCNLYGATKLCSDKVFIAGNYYAGEKETKFGVVRYGNVVGSRGSVIPFFKEKVKSGVLPVTDERMTRFWITLDQAVDLVYKTFSHMQGGEIFVKKVPSMKITELVKAFGDEIKTEVVGIRPGEKLHEILISDHDSAFTYEFDDHFRIFPSIFQETRWNRNQGDGGKKVESGYEYASDTNTHWLTKEEIKKLIDQC